MRRVAITGIGLVTPLGNTPASFFDALMAGRSGIVCYAPENLPGPVSVPAGTCDFRGEDHFSRAELIGLDRISQFSLYASRQAWVDAGVALDPEQLLDAGVCWGVGMGGAQTLETAYIDALIRNRPRVHPLTVPNAMHNAPAAHIALKHALGGAAITYSVACASSAVAIGEAARRIQSGEAPLMVAGGCEALLTFGAIRAWESLQVLARGNAETAYRACRPFSCDRDGLVLAEGACAMVLEDWDHALSRGARIHAELTGYGITCDRSHITRPNAEGQLRAMQKACLEAGIAPGELDYINAHGTATQEGDRSECEAISSLLDQDVDRVRVSSTKSMHGHAMGAAGAIEFAATVLAITQRGVPPTAHLADADPSCAVRHVPMRGEADVTVRNAMSNSFAFGGTNAVLIAQAVQT